MSQQKIIWIAIVFSTVLYVVIAYSMAPVPVRPFGESLQAPLTLALYGVAFSMFVAAMVVPPLLGQAPPRTKFIISLALFESCAILGLVTVLMQHDWRLILAPWIASLIGFLRQWPGDEISPAA